MAKIICARCQVEDEVDFEPSEEARILCASCHDRIRLEAQRVKEEQTQSAPERGPKKPPPRKKHGTRIFLPIECTACGKKETLDYVPKGGSLDEVLCSGCALKKWGEKSRWAEVARKKEKEQKTEFEFVCIDCGRIDYLGTPPMKGRTYQCARCYYEHEEPHKERLEDRERVEKSVFIRKRKKN
jgi:hypothetical protein